MSPGLHWNRPGRGRVEGKGEWERQRVAASCGCRRGAGEAHGGGQCWISQQARRWLQRRPAWRQGRALLLAPPGAKPPPQRTSGTKGEGRQDGQADHELDAREPHHIWDLGEGAGMRQRAGVRRRWGANPRVGTGASGARPFPITAAPAEWKGSHTARHTKRSHWPATLLRPPPTCLLRHIMSPRQARWASMTTKAKRAVQKAQRARRS